MIIRILAAQNRFTKVICSRCPTQTWRSLLAARVCSTDQIGKELEVHCMRKKKKRIFNFH